MLTLPAPPRRAGLRAIWLVLSIAAGLAVAVLDHWLGGRFWEVPGALASVLIGVPGWRHDRWALRLLERWNRRARGAARVSRFCLNIAAYAIVTVAGRAGSRMRWHAPAAGASGWLPRAMTVPFGGPGDLEGHGDAREPGWLAELIAWTRATDNRWVWPLVPYIVLLSGIDSSTRGSMGKDIYTLY